MIFNEFSTLAFLGKVANLIKKKYFIIITLILVLSTAIFIYSKSKNQYFKDINKVIEYVESTKTNHVIISLLEVERNLSVSMKTLHTISPNEDSQNFNLSMELLNFVKDYQYNKNQTKNNLESKIYLLKFAIQIDKGNDTDLYYLPVYFDSKFEFFAIPKNYNNANIDDSTNLKFYPINDIKYQKIAKMLFEQ